MHMNQEKKFVFSLASFLFWSSSSNLSLALLPIILFLSASYCLCVLSWWMLRFKATFTRAVISFIAAKAQDRLWLFTCSQSSENISSADPYSQQKAPQPWQSYLERHFHPGNTQVIGPCSEPESIPHTELQAVLLAVFSRQALSAPGSQHVSLQHQGTMKAAAGELQQLLHRTEPVEMAPAKGDLNQWLLRMAQFTSDHSTASLNAGLTRL